jgi:hypothetical protein
MPADDAGPVGLGEGAPGLIALDIAVPFRCIHFARLGFISPRRPVVAVK